MFNIIPKCPTDVPEIETSLAIQIFANIILFRSVRCVTPFTASFLYVHAIISQYYAHGPNIIKLDYAYYYLLLLLLRKFCCYAKFLPKALYR